MAGRCGLCRLLARYLAVLALVLVLAPTVARAVEPDPRLAQNPALDQVAAADPAEARRLLDDLDRVLRRPVMRGGPFLDAADEALLAGNPLLEQAFAHDPAAAVELLERIKASGGKGNGK